MVRSDIAERFKKAGAGSSLPRSSITQTGREIQEKNLYLPRSFSQDRGILEIS